MNIKKYKVKEFTKLCLMLKIFNKIYEQVLSRHMDNCLSLYMLTVEQKCRFLMQYLVSFLSVSQYIPVVAKTLRRKSNFQINKW
jgi:hypothetical protein